MDLYGEVGGVEGTACGWAAVPTIVPSTARRRTSAKMPAPPTRSSAPSAAAVPIKMSIAFRPASLSGRSRTAKRVRGSAASALVARPPPAAIAVKSVADHAAPTSASFLRGVKNEYNPRHPNDYSAYVEAKSNERKRQKMERQLSDDAERRRREERERLKDTGESDGDQPASVAIDIGSDSRWNAYELVRAAARRARAHGGLRI